MLDDQKTPHRSASLFSSSKLTATAASGVPSRGLFMIELVFALLITRIPYLSVPFKWLESYFHELSHGIATILSSGIVSHIQLFPNGAGFCFSQGGSPLLIGFAGYFGAACWGYLIYLLATWPKGIRVSFALLGALVVLSGLLWGRDLLTLAILAVLTIILLLPLKLSQNKILTQFLRIIGLMIMLNALASPTVLLGLGQGDAVMLAERSWIPAWIWVGLWLLTSACALYLTWRRVDNAANR
ncbi:membrane zinc metalloprotease [Shewanella morhuae]|uniref:Membrane zinc metalloprotease n=1 Tax=Shewanella morhuae TaxID=365591 RepID=A0ABX5HV93_9GAMM|nr:M50 family metallopeptidase [Shewanella morhuae]PTA50072.1 membrane zinc metalloprotease [Shewanella morhuae]GIU03731.1 membrane zinc metalloprotease [Shewanella morhuae]SIR17250.1 Peptidase M50B-like [Shewanella morhuae]